MGDLIDVATEYGIITKSGSWYSYKTERTQGRDGVRKILLENNDLYLQLEKEVIESFKNKHIKKDASVEVV